jgi:hypothetical protein
MQQPSAGTPPEAAPIARQCCRNHASREAVARCPQCGHFYCRECVTEHENRMLCNACLAQATAKANALGRVWRNRLEVIVYGGMGFCLLWVAFYLIGLGLLAIPHAYHEGTIWQTPWWQAP